ncbi:hypothetical protein C8R44DRAFT_749391 [Mycena epipterygia]|nr:hypothetical protein C8R44DRAFT_749391 [Mycena epipterygia]
MYSYHKLEEGESISQQVRYELPRGLNERRSCERGFIRPTLKLLLPLHRRHSHPPDSRSGRRGPVHWPQPHSLTVLLHSLDAYHPNGIVNNNAVTLTSAATSPHKDEGTHEADYQVTLGLTPKSASLSARMPPSAPPATRPWTVWLQKPMKKAGIPLSPPVLDYLAADIRHPPQPPVLEIRLPRRARWSGHLQVTAVKVQAWRTAPPVLKMSLHRRGRKPGALTSPCCCIDQRNSPLPCSKSAHFAAGAGRDVS